MQEMEKERMTMGKTAAKETDKTREIQAEQFMFLILVVRVATPFSTRFAERVSASSGQHTYIPPNLCYNPIRLGHCVITRRNSQCREMKLKSDLYCFVFYISRCGSSETTSVVRTSNEHYDLD
jgi:hypothetical protein